MNDWISVKDHLPKEGELVLLVRLFKNEPIVSLGYKASGDYFYISGSRTKSITHWMPMPDLPKEGE